MTQYIYRPGPSKVFSAPSTKYNPMNEQPTLTRRWQPAITIQPELNRMPDLHSSSAAQAPTAVQSPGFAASRWLTVLCASLLALAALASYYNSFAGAFVFDDQTWIVENASIRHLWPIWSWLTPRESVFVAGRPVVSLSLAVNYALCGLNPWGYHAVNLAIHILTAWTLFGLVRRTLRLPPPDSSSPPKPPPESDSLSLAEKGPDEPRFASAATPLALAAALLWTVHPLQTEAVTYVIQRTESLVALFYLFTLYCLLRGATATAAARWWYCATVLSCLLGMATKEVMVTAPLVALIYDRTFLSGSFRKALAERLELYLALAACWWIVSWQLTTTRFHGGTTGSGAAGFTAWSYFLTQPGVLVHYLRLVFWPTGLCFLYDWQPANSLADVLLPGLLIVGLLGLTVWALVKRPGLGFLGAAFFLVLAPTSTFIPIFDAVAEHRMYLPLAAVALLLVLAGHALFDWLWPRASDAGRGSLARATAGAAVLVVALIGLGRLTILRNADYDSELGFSRDIVNKFPNHSRSHYNMGCTLAAHKLFGEAIHEYEAALALEPVFYPAGIHNNMGLALREEKRDDLAIAEFEKSLDIDPQHAVANNNLALALSATGQTAAAIESLRKAVAIDPNYVNALLNLAVLLSDAGQSDEAIELCQRALKVEPDNAAAHLAFSHILDRAGRTEEALQHVGRALEIQPQLRGTPP